MGKESMKNTLSSIWSYYLNVASEKITSRGINFWVGRSGFQPTPKKERSRFQPKSQKSDKAKEWVLSRISRKRTPPCELSTITPSQTRVRQCRGVVTCATPPRGCGKKRARGGPTPGEVGTRGGGGGWAERSRAGSGPGHPKNQLDLVWPRNFGRGAVHTGDCCSRIVWNKPLSSRAPWPDRGSPLVATSADTECLCVQGNAARSPPNSRCVPSLKLSTAGPGTEFKRW